MSHEHCDKCYQLNCLQSSACPMIDCPHGCASRMHQCKREDHDHVCPNVFVPCVNAVYGCPSTMKREHINRHLTSCPASVVVCQFTHMYQSHSDESTVNEDSLLNVLARRDNLWSNYIQEYERKQKESLALFEQEHPKQRPVERVIRSEKYRYITMPECMLSRGDGMICSTCRKHIRQLEENEDQRLAEATEEERNLMAHLNLGAVGGDDLTHAPSLVKMSLTPIHRLDVPDSALIQHLDVPEPSSQKETTRISSPMSPTSIQSDIEHPLSFIHRLTYFSSDPQTKNLYSFSGNPEFACAAFCRRDEIERHWLIHYSVDCVLSTSLIQRCPKFQYGCSFQSTRMEPCRSNGQPIRIRFDRRNDAIAFEFTPTDPGEPSESVGLMDLPSELLMAILSRLDSLSIRNASLVCSRLRTVCQDLLPTRGIVTNEYERHPPSYGNVTWKERRKHWLFTNTSSAVPKWQLTDHSECPSLAQHIATCPYGETKDLQNEPRFPLPAWTDPSRKMAEKEED